MRSVRIVAVASHTPDWLRRVEKQYQQQMAMVRLTIDTIKAAPTLEKEAQALMTAVQSGNKKSYCVLLDAGGDVVDSRAFAERLHKWMAASAPLVFVIGGANGVGDSFLPLVNARLSLSALTLPHALARLLLVEQVFRADCHFRNHPYPR